MPRVTSAMESRLVTQLVKARFCKSASAGSSHSEMFVGYSPTRLATLVTIVNCALVTPVR